MADKKISQLNEVINPNNTDFLPVVNAGLTKKVTLDNLVQQSTYSTNNIGSLTLQSNLNSTDQVPIATGAGLPRKVPGSVFATSTQIQTLTGILNTQTQTVSTILDTKISSVSSVTATGTLSARTLQDRFADVINVKDFGAVGDGVTDDTPAIQAFFNFITTNGRTGYLSKGQYKCDSSLTITLGGPSFRIIGDNSESTVIFASSTFSGTNFLSIIGTDTNTEWSIGGFRIANSGSITGKIGLTIGSPSSSFLIRGYHNSLIHDVRIDSFERLMDIVHARMINFDRVGFWGNPNTTDCTRIYQNGIFAGDLNFNACQWVSEGTSAGKCNVAIISNTGSYSNLTGNNSIAGIRFNGCVFYAGEKSVRLYAGSGSVIGDLFFTGGCQWDQQTTYNVYVEANGASTFIDTISMESGWMNRSTSEQLYFLSSSNGKIRNVFVSQTTFIQGLAAGIKVVDPVGTNCTNFMLIGNTFLDHDFTTGGCIEFNGGRYLTVAFNRCRRGLLNKFPLNVVRIGANTAQFTIIGNDSGEGTLGGVINDSSGDVLKTVVNNIGFNPFPTEFLVLSGSSPYIYKNITGYPVLMHTWSGTVSSVTIDDAIVGYNSAGTIYPLRHGSTINIAFTVAPNVNRSGL